jgi:hypothetical protein
MQQSERPAQVKNALMPMPGANASGILATKPIRKHEMSVEMAVAPMRERLVCSCVQSVQQRALGQRTWRRQPVRSRHSDFENCCAARHGQGLAASMAMKPIMAWWAPQAMMSCYQSTPLRLPYVADQRKRRKSDIRIRCEWGSPQKRRQLSSGTVWPVRLLCLMFMTWKGFNWAQKPLCYRSMRQPINDCFLLVVVVILAGRLKKRLADCVCHNNTSRHVSGTPSVSAIVKPHNPMPLSE